jgi:hypothetical protein
MHMSGGFHGQISLSPGIKPAVDAGQVAGGGGQNQRGHCEGTEKYVLLSQKESGFSINPADLLFDVIMLMSYLFWRS